MRNHIQLLSGTIEVAGETQQFEQEYARRHVRRPGFYFLRLPLDGRGKVPLVKKLSGCGRHTLSPE
jgi:hypothetical protein